MIMVSTKSINGSPVSELSTVALLPKRAFLHCASERSYAFQMVSAGQVQAGEDPFA